MEGPRAPAVDHQDRPAEDVAVDHSLHWLALLSAAGYAWKLHGLIAAIAFLIGLLIAISATNLILLAKSGSLRLVRMNRWTWVVLAFLLLAVSGASGGSV